MAARLAPGTLAGQRIVEMVALAAPAASKIDGHGPVIQPLGRTATALGAVVRCPRGRFERYPVRTRPSIWLHPFKPGRRRAGAPARAGDASPRRAPRSARRASRPGR